MVWIGWCVAPRLLVLSPTSFFVIFLVHHLFHRCLFLFERTVVMNIIKLFHFNPARQ